RAFGVLARRFGPPGDRHDDRVAVGAAVALGPGVDGLRQHDGAAHARVVRLEPRALALAAQRAGDALDAAVDDRDHLALGAARTPRTHADLHAVSVHCAAERLGRDEHVVACGVEARDEPEAPWVY